MGGGGTAAAAESASTAETSGSPGVTSLSASTYSVAQNAGSVTLIVNRTGGASGEASVHYATANATAEAGTDYTTEHGRFSWADGDASPRALVIPISNAAPFTGAKTLAVAIARARGATLGSTTSAIVTIQGSGTGAPTVSLSASPTSVASGGSSMLVWSANGATSCTASGGWSGTQPMSGSQSTGALAASATYSLSCTGSGGSASQSATVIVNGTALAIASPSTLSAATKGAAYSDNMAASGGTPPYSWSLISEAGSSNAWSVSSAGVVSGTPGVSETDSLVIKVADKLGNTTQGTFSLKVGAGGTLAIATPAALPNGTIGRAYATTLQASGGKSPYSWTLLSNSSDRLSSSTSQATPANNAYSINASTGVLSYSGSLAGAETDYFYIEATDSAGVVAKKEFAMTVSSSSNPLVIATPSNLGNVAQGAAYTSSSPLATLTAVGAVGPLSWSILSQTSTQTNNNWSINASTGAISGAAGNTGTDTLDISVTDGTNTATGYVNVSVYQYVSGAPRPSYNKGSGFFVLNGEIYEPNGNLFRMRGIDQQDAPSTPNVGWWNASGVNTVRADSAALSSLAAEASNVSALTTVHTNNHRFVLPFRGADRTGYAITTGSSVLGLSSGSNSGMGQIITDWVSAYEYGIYSPIMNKIAINIANEWGSYSGNTGSKYQTAYQAVSGTISGISGNTITLSDGTSTNPFVNAVGLTVAYIKGASGLSDQLITITGVGGSSGAWTVTSSTSLSGWTGGGTLWGGAVGILRAVGYTCPFVIDAGGGQDSQDFVNYGPAIFQSDPFKSVVFSFHLYAGIGPNNGDGPGDLTQAEFEQILASFNAMRATYGMAFYVGEFGVYAVDNGNNGYANGGSQTQFPTPQVLQSAEKYGIGDSPWALDSGGTTQTDFNANGFLYDQNSSSYGYPSAIKVWGKRAMLDPVRGSVVLATAPTSF
jgi:hypothetical protein